MMSKNVIVTGGAGFVGSHLVKVLLEQGNSVTCVDNYCTGSAENIRKYLDFKNFRMIKHDVCDPLKVEADQIYHLACPASPVHYQEDHIKTLQTSILGVMNFLKLAAENGARILQASTSEIYGDPLEHPQIESYLGNTNCFGERACYDEGKRVGEALCYAYQKEFGLDVRIARIFNTYGPSMQINDGRVVSNFIVQALQNKPITIYGDGSQTRSFCYVSDLVEGLVKLMSSDVDVPVNLGNQGEFTILEAAELIIELTGSKSVIEHQPLPSDDPKVRCPNTERAKQELGWVPKVSFREGLETTISYFENRLFDPGAMLAVLDGKLPAGAAYSKEPCVSVRKPVV